jgi:hypothetical protein
MSRGVPAVNTAQDLVHSDLLMGKNWAQPRPTAMPAAPPMTSPLTVTVAERAALMKWPVKTPKSVVAMAGTVLRIPSGS